LSDIIIIIIIIITERGGDNSHITMTTWCTVLN